MSIKRSAIIITYGRTGSTLLVGLLNTAKRTLIRGENANCFYHLFKSYEALVKARQRGGAQPNHPFFGIKDANVDGYLSLCKQAVNTVLSPGATRFSGPTTIGFKEIRYLDMPEGELRKYVAFLEQIFPDPVFVFLTRNHEEVASSGFYVKLAKNTNVIEQLQTCDRNFAKIAGERDDAFSIDYKDLKLDSDRLKELFAFIGLNYDEAEIARILQIDHSPQTPPHLKKRTWPQSA